MKSVARLLSSALACAVVLGAPSAHAQEATSKRATSSLSWVRLPGAEACLSASELSTRVEAKLGRAVFVSPSVAEVAIEARAELLPNAQVHVVVQGTRRDGTVMGSRELTGADCKSLEDSLVLVLALMIDRDATAPKPEPPTPEPPPAPPPQPVEDVVRERVIIHELPREREPKPTPPEPWKIDVLAAGQLALGRTPGSAPGVFVGGVVELPHFVPIELGFDALPSNESDGPHHVGISELAWDGAVCPRFSLGERVRAGVCAGVRLGTFTARGSGFAETTDQTSLLADVRMAPRVEVFVVGPVFVYTAPALSVPLSRQHVSFTDSAGQRVTVYERPAIGGDLLLGVGVRFLP